MYTVELVYDAECPHVKDARANLLQAFARAGLAARWQEWDRGAPGSPALVRGYGSPTILVDGRDVADAAPSDGNCCRLYTNQQGRLQGVPPVELIVAALRGNHTRHRQRGGWRGSLAAMPAIGIALLPRFT